MIDGLRRLALSDSTSSYLSFFPPENGLKNQYLKRRALFGILYDGIVQKLSNPNYNIPSSDPLRYHSSVPNSVRSLPRDVRYASYDMILRLFWLYTRTYIGTLLGVVN
jgi:hypothetical protein